MFLLAQNYGDAFLDHQIIDRLRTVIWAKKSSNASPPAIMKAVDDDFLKTFKKHDLYLESNGFLGECMLWFWPGFNDKIFQWISNC